jgi:hypothetical protein
MSADEKQRAEEQILQWLHTSSPQDVRDLLNRAPSVPISSSALERAVWYLVDGGKARFTTDWKLSLNERAG